MVRGSTKFLRTSSIFCDNDDPSFVSPGLDLTTSAACDRRARPMPSSVFAPDDRNLGGWVLLDLLGNTAQLQPATLATRAVLTAQRCSSSQTHALLLVLRLLSLPLSRTPTVTFQPCGHHPDLDSPQESQDGHQVERLLSPASNIRSVSQRRPTYLASLLALTALATSLSHAQPRLAADRTTLA